MAEKGFWKGLRRCPECKYLGRLHRVLEERVRAVPFLFSFPSLLSALELCIFSSSFLEDTEATGVSEGLKQLGQGCEVLILGILYHLKVKQI